MIITTEILLSGNNTGIVVPEAALQQLGGGKKPLVTVTLNGYTYRGAVARMGDNFLIALSAEHRKNAGVTGGETVEVDISLDTAPRTVAPTPELLAAMEQHPGAKSAFEQLSPSKQKAMVLSITDAKTDDTRDKRIAKAVKDLLGV